MLKNINEKQYSIQISFEGEIVEKSNLFNDSSSAEELLILQDAITFLEGGAEFDKSAQNITLNFKTL